MTNKITFIARDKYGYEVCPRPYPATQAIPDWWKNMTPYTPSTENPDGKKIIINNRQSNATFKKCQPMLDAITSGYIIPLWADVQVVQKNGLPEISWRVKREVFEFHGINLGVEIPDGYSKIIFKYINTWFPKVPKGYSILVTEPFGYRNLPFKAVPGIMDTDSSPHELAPPVFIKEGFEGIIERGTPICQVTPFKRTDWKSEFDFYEEGEYSMIEDRDVSATLVNNYIKNFWTKKTYK